MLTIKPVEKWKKKSFRFLGRDFEFRWTSPGRKEQRDSREQAFHLAQLYATSENRPYGLFIDGDNKPLITVNPVKEVGSNVDYCV